MSILSSVRIALRALAANKLRTILTMLGMIIGVAAVISLMSVGRGAQAAVTRGLERGQQCIARVARELPALTKLFVR